MLESLYKKSFHVKVNRVEEWMGGKCIRNQIMDSEVIATVVGEKINFKLIGADELRVLKEFSLDIYAKPMCVLPDRIQYSTMSDFDPIVPIVCHIFVKPEIYVRLAMINPDRIIEFYGDFNIIDSSEEELGGNRIMYYNSFSHLRHQSGIPVGGLQTCHRVIEIVKNTEGCEGYILEPGRGFIVKMFNPELGQAQMADKPMEVVSEQPNCLELRGFSLPAMSPFGWVQVDNSDYGLKVYHTNGQVEKCVLYMYDRDVYIEYY